MKVQSSIVAISLLSSLASALPAVKRDSSINEPAVISPNGTPITLSNAPEATGVDNSNSNSGSNSCYGDSCNSNDNSNDCMSGDCNSNMDSTSQAWSYTTSSAMSESTSTEMMDSTSTWDAYTNTYQNTYTTADYTSTASSWESTADATSTSSSWMASATYGSGYSSSGYDSCVQQCMASYAPPPSMVTATPSYPAGYDNGSSGSGATHTVIVAPTQGVLRYVPFAVNASVGDTVRFVWGAGPHTVTKSSQFNLCNATSDHPFKSGMQNKSFVFDQVVNDTNPTFYYCGVPNHCEKGMFGIINPPIAEPGAQNSAQGMGAMMAQNNSDVSAQWSYMMMNTQNNSAASGWGGSMDISAMTNDPAGQLAMVQNMMFTRVAMAQNDKYITSDGGFNPDIASGMSIPVDPLKITAANSTAPSGSNNAASSPSGSSTASTAPAASSSTGAASRSRVTSSATAIFAAVAIAALVL